MKIDVLDKFNLGDAGIAWSLSRDPDMPYNQNDVTLVDAPVNEMPSMLLHFSDFTIIEREIFTTPRNHVIWARTSRVDEPTEFRLPKGWESSYFEALRRDMIDLKRSGVAQDIYRMRLPIAALTSWTARMDLRSVRRMIAYFGFLQNLLPWGPLASRYSAVAAQLCHIIGENPKPNMFVKYLHDGSLADTYVGMKRTGKFTEVTASVPIALRAQLARHRELQFVDTFFAWATDTTLTGTLNDPVRMQVVGTDEAWRGVLSRRSCWMADHSLWQPITRHFGASMLPCADGSCPYAVDAQQRLAGTDPGVPCPRYCNLTGTDKQPYEAAMLASARQRGSEYWIQETLA